MKAIIDGFKYDTETATFIMDYMLNEYEKGELFRNRKYKFFAVHMLQKESGRLEYEHKILPLTKTNAMELLVNFNNIEKFEELIGEIPEPEGEDYISEDNIESVSEPELRSQPGADAPAVVEETASNVLNQPNKPKKVWRVQRKLSKACKDNDIETVKACLICGAVVQHRHIRQAIINENLDMVNLLIAVEGFKLRKKEIELAVLKGNVPVFKSLIEKAPQMHDVALNIGKKHLVVSIVEYLEKVD